MKLVCMCHPVSKIRGLSGFQPLQQDWPLAAYKYQIIVLGLVLRACIGTEIKCFFKIKLILGSQIQVTKHAFKTLESHGCQSYYEHDIQYYTRV